MAWSRRHLLASCIAASFLFHGAALFFLAKRSLWVEATPVHLGEKLELQDTVLQEVFASFRPETGKPLQSPLASLSRLPKPLETPVSPAKSAESQLIIQLTTPPALSPPLFTRSELVLAPSPSIAPPPAPTVPPPPSPNPALPLTSPPTLPPYSPSFSSHLTLAPLVPPHPTPPFLSSRPSLPSLSELNTLSASDAFDIDLSCIHHQGKIIFAITFLPKNDLDLPLLPSHYTFIIDRSNSIQKERLEATKAAVLKAASELPSQDTFNILLFDSKTEKLFSSPVNPNKETLKTASERLEQAELGSLFSTSDLLNPLLLTLPGSPSELVHQVILFTDGETLSKKATQKSLFSKWTPFNNGRVSLHAVAMSIDRDLATLDALTAFNKGKCITSTTLRGIKRRTLKLMKALQEPVAKDISCSLFASHPISLHLSYSNLYLDQPFTLIGETTTMDDFVLFLQGHIKGKWINIRKTISLATAAEGGESLAVDWTMQQAYQHYEHYIRDENRAHIAEANELLRPFDIQAAFQ